MPLLIASSIALENFEVEDSSIRNFASAQLAALKGVTVVAPTAHALPHILSIVANDVAGEPVVRELSALEIDVDSGSACSPEDLQPSHVLAAMGHETKGHLRFTFHNETTRDEITALVKALHDVLQNLRR